MTRSIRRTAAALAVALTAVVATTLGAMPAQADVQAANQPGPILPIPPFTTPTPTPAPTPDPPKATSTPTKHAAPKPAHTSHATTKKKAKAKKHTRSVSGTSSAASAATTGFSSAASNTSSSTSTSRSVAPTKAKAPRPQKSATQVAAPDFAATTPVQPATATPQAAPTATAELVSSTSQNALPLWVPVLLLGFLGVLTAGTLRYRRRTGGV